MMNRFLLSIFAFFLYQIGVAQFFHQPESIVYDAARDRYVVSNAGTSSMVVVSADGEKSNYGTMGTGSHGLAIMGSKLYSCHKNVIYIHDLVTDTKVGEYRVEGAVFLNGLSTDGTNRLFATDFTKRKIFELLVDSAGDISQSELGQTDKMPNGLAYDGKENRLIIVTWGRNADILELDLATQYLRTVKETKYNNLESVILDDEGNMYITGWIPANLLKYDEELDEIQELNIFDLSNPTGLIFDDRGELIILSSSSDQWMTVPVKSTRLEDDMEISAFPNPMVTNSIISYTLESEGEVNICVYDSQGKMVQQLIEEKKEAGSHQFLMNRKGISAGLYFVNVRTPNSSSAMPMTITD